MDLPAGLQQFALEVKGFADWIGYFLPGITAVCRGFTKMKNENPRQNQQITVLIPKQVDLNVDNPFENEEKLIN